MKRLTYKNGAGRSAMLLNGQEVTGKIPERLADLETAAEKAHWHDAEKEQPALYRPVLLFLPDEAPMLTVHEGYYAGEPHGFMTLRFGRVRTEEVKKWRYMPEGDDLI